MYFWVENKIMEATEMRKNLISSFNKIIDSDYNLAVLEGVFDAFSKEETISKIPNAHYLMVDKKRHEYFEDKSKGTSWVDFEKNLNGKYGF